MSTLKKSRSLLYNVLIFVLAQIAWLMLLGIWIYWYVINYIIFEKVENQISPQILYDGINVLPFVGGIILLVGIWLGMSLTFRHLNLQIRLHNLYDNFIANVTHELKSPLSSIQLYLETLKSRNVPDEKKQEFYDQMIKDSERLRYLIDSILEIAAIDQKKAVYNYEVVSINEEIEKVVAESAEQFKIPSENLIISNKQTGKCVIDKNAIKIVFDNLIDNAVKYSTGNPEIKINMKRGYKKYMVEFTDNGIGIEKENLKEIFNKFHRIYNRDIPTVKGTGLGLYWVKEIIKNHGGSIIAFSEGRNKGTSFRIELPLYPGYRKRFFNKLLKNRKLKKTENIYDG
ncbi:MAG: HAMP domain-containing histidine kinase [Melioribacteraceae bacterium]|nr:HAMP domain-containing histidine kinase [Melioribacteraceae bacterium]